jgi:hypothetical protein
MSHQADTHVFISPEQRTENSGMWNTARQMRAWAYRSRQKAFDRRFGVNTTGTVDTHELDVDEEGRKSGNHYEATPRSVFLRMVRSIHIDPRRFSFVDIGSGKGAVLLYASQFPFKRIIGIEHSHRLNEIAEMNIRNYRGSDMQCTDIATLCLDATAYSLPADPLVLYFWNPFKEEMMSRMVANIERSFKEHPRDMVLIFLHPNLEVVLDRVNWLERVDTGWNHAIYRTKL